MREKRIWVSFNPAQDVLKIRLVEMYQYEGADLHISVINTEGQIMHHQEVYIEDEYVYIPCKNWPSGVYLISVEKEGKVYNEAVMIMNE